MKTNDLIAALARGAGPAPRAVVARRLVPAAVLGLAAAAFAAVAVIGPAPADMLGGVALWTKLAYGGALAAVGAWLSGRLARPVSHAAAGWRVGAAVVLLMTLLGASSFAAVPAGQRVEHLLGHSWFVCPWSVLALSLPALAGALWALRGLAPTRPRPAGAAAGLLAGALGALGYALACPEVSLAFIAVWYTLGVALAVALGGWLGPRVLRW